MSLHAVRDCILVELVYDEKKGRIFIPDVSKQYHGGFYCRVVSIGPEYRYKKDLKVGDKIYIIRHEGHKICVGSKTYFSMRSKWCVARLEDK